MGKFFAPICRAKGVKGFVFLDHGSRDIELRLACRNYPIVEAKMDRLAAKLGIVRRPNTATPGQTVGNGAYHSPDVIERNRGRQCALAQRRSELLFGHLDAGCALYFDTLVSVGNYFQAQINSNLPLGNLFERCLHLVTNFSKAEFIATVGLNNNNRVATTAGMTRLVSATINAQGAEECCLHL